jgi:hypothetical protein
MANYHQPLPLNPNTRFPIIVQYKGDTHVTIIYKPSELKELIAFTVIETNAQ